MHNDIRLQQATDRLLSGETLSSLVREYPEYEGELRAFAGAILPLSAMKGALPSRDSLREALSSARLAEARSASQTSYAWYYAYAMRLILPVLVLALAVGGYFVLEPRTEPEGGAPQSRDAAMESAPSLMMTTDVPPGAGGGVSGDTSLRSFKAGWADPAMPGVSPTSLMAPSSLRILIVGDVMLDRTVRTKGRETGYAALFDGVRSYLDAHDRTLINLEGPITDHRSVSEGSAVGSPENTTFTFDREVAPLLAEIRAIAHLGNNHALDFGYEGLESTRMYLDGQGVSYFGAPGDGANKALALPYDGRTVTLISYNQFAPKQEGQSEAALALSLVREHRALGELVIVYAHWSEEYQTMPTASVRSLAHQFVDAGATLVVGAHPHVVGEKEIYRGVPVYYSLGNFVFDQYWEQAVRCGLALSIEVTKGNMNILDEIPVAIEKGGVTRMGAEAGEACPES